MDIYSLLQTIIFLIPVAALIWKASQLSAKIDRNADEIAKLWNSEKEFRTVVSEIKGSINDIKISTARIEEKITKTGDKQ